MPMHHDIFYYQNCQTGVVRGTGSIIDRVPYYRSGICTHALQHSAVSYQSL